jgi:hypothetical protein
MILVSNVFIKAKRRLDPYAYASLSQANQLISAGLSTYIFALVFEFHYIHHKSILRGV